MLKRLLTKVESIYKYRYLSKVQNGAYKFLLNKVHKSTDINFVERVFQMDHFRAVLVPLHLQLSEFKNVLVLAPHQDDEVIGCGGTMLKMMNHKTQLTIGFLTDGEELSNLNKSIYVRASEANRVADSLNATVRNLGISNTKVVVKKEHIDELASWLNEDFDAVFTVWPVDVPPKHRLCAYLFGKALKKSNFTGKIILYSVHTDLLPSVYVEITDVIEKKQQLISFYESQMKGQCYGHLSKGLDAWRARFLESSPNPRFIETFMQIPVEAYDDFMKILETTSTKELLKGDEVCVEGFNELRRL